MRSAVREDIEALSRRLDALESFCRIQTEETLQASSFKRSLKKALLRPGFAPCSKRPWKAAAWSKRGTAQAGLSAIRLCKSPF